MVALQQVALPLPQQVQLLGSFDALGGHLHPEALGKSDQRRHQRAIGGIVGAEVLNQRTVEFENLGRQAVEAAEAGIAGAEVVNGES